MFVGSLPMRSKQGWLVTYLILPSHMSALFVTSLIQTARHKMAALTVVFLAPFKR